MGAVDVERVLGALERLRPGSPADEADYCVFAEVKALLEQSFSPRLAQPLLIDGALQQKLLHFCRAFVRLNRPDLFLRVFILLELGEEALPPADLLFLGEQLFRVFERGERSPFLARVKEIALARLVPQVFAAADAADCEELLFAWLECAEKIRLLDEEFLRAVFGRLEARARRGRPLSVENAVRLVRCCAAEAEWGHAAGRLLLDSLDRRAELPGQLAFDALCAYCLLRVSQSFHARKAEPESRLTCAFTWAVDAVAGEVPQRVADLLSAAAAASTRFQATEDMAHAILAVLSGHGLARQLVEQRVDTAAEARSEFKPVLSTSELEACLLSAGQPPSADLARILPGVRAALQTGRWEGQSEVILVIDSFHFCRLGHFKGSCLLKLFRHISARPRRVVCLDKELLAFFLISGSLHDLLQALAGPGPANLVTVNYAFLAEGPGIFQPQPGEQAPAALEAGGGALGLKP